MQAWQRENQSLMLMALTCIEQTTEITATALPGEPLAGWESITADNCEEMAKKIPPVMPGIHSALYGHI